jgi:hypothetical protein
MTETISPAETPAAAETPHLARQRQIQDCVDQILAKVDAGPAGR